MSSWKSHENVVQGHLVTLGSRLKKEKEQKDCMPLAPISMYGKTVKTSTMEGFAELTHQCESCIEGN